MKSMNWSGMTRAPSSISVSREPTAELETTYRGSYLTHLGHRAPAWAGMLGFLAIFGWRIIGVMLIGMAFFKTGILTGARSSRFYWALLILGFGGGILGPNRVRETQAEAKPQEEAEDESAERGGPWHGTLSPGIEESFQARFKRMPADRSTTFCSAIPNPGSSA